MSPSLTQPEEIDQILKEMNDGGLALDLPTVDTKNNVPDKQNWKGASMSPYRAEYLKSLGSSARNDSV